MRDIRNMTQFVKKKKRFEANVKLGRMGAINTPIHSSLMSG
jgi:hypothetical protein